MLSYVFVSHLLKGQKLLISLHHIMVKVAFDPVLILSYIFLSYHSKDQKLLIILSNVSYIKDTLLPKLIDISARNGFEDLKNHQEVCMLVLVLHFLKLLPCICTEFLRQKA